MIEESNHEKENVEVNNEAKLGWLIIIALKTFDTKNRIKRKPFWERKIDNVQILQYIATNQEIDKLTKGLNAMLLMSMPRDREILIMIDYKGICFNQNNKITTSQKGEP